MRGAQAQPVLEARGITVHFGGLIALDSVDLTVQPGSILGLIGPNGAGKTTLFHALSGLLSPDRGSVHLGARDVTRLGPARRARLGLARTFQRVQLFAELDVRHNLALASRARLGRGSIWRDLAGLARPDRGEAARVDALLGAFGLGELARAPVETLPLGTSRLVEVARALATQPSVVLLDEPSSGLDADETRHLGAVLRRVSDDEGVAFVLVEHDLDLVMSLCERVQVLDFGQTIATGTPEEIRANLSVRAAYLGDSP